jgi:hypothetical protein
MALFLAVVGGTVVVEIHRALTGNKDVKELQEREKSLKRKLEVI